MHSANIVIFMKKSIFLSSLLAVCVTCVAQADEVHQEIFIQNGTKNVDGNLTVNRLQLGAYAGNVAKLSVTGKTTINSNLTDRNACQVQAGSTLESDEIEFICSTKGYSKTFSILGTVKTNKFTVSGTEEFPAIFSFTQGKLESLNPEKKGTLEIGENVQASVGNGGKSANVTVDMNTVINGGTLNVKYYATMDGITLNGGTINIINTPDPVWNTKPIEGTIDLGDIIVENGTLSLQEAAIVSDITMNAGELNIIGDVETGALTLNNCAVNFSADAAIDLGEESLILGDKVAITLNVDSLDNIEGVTLFKTTGNVTGLDALTVTFMDATGTTKEAAVSFSNGSVVTSNIPEPTTATLSLLALAGLAARRRRK